MLRVLLLLACLSGYVFILRRQLAVPGAAAPAALIGVIVTTLYAADFVGALGAATYALYAIGGVAFAAQLYTLTIGRNAVPSKDEALPLLLVMLAFLWLYRMQSGGAYCDWDEFSHWGTIIKAIYSADTFHFNPNPLYFQDYPPGTALFSYFVLKLLGYSEGRAYFAYDLILLAFCLPVLGLVWRHGLRWLAITMVLMLLLLSRKGLGFGWSTTLIDHILSVIFGGTIAAYFLMQREGRRLWPLSAMLAFLVLAKHAGQSLAILTVAVCAIDMLVCRIMTDDSSELDHPSASALITTVSTASGLLILPLVVGLSWRHYVVDNGLVQSFSQVSLPGLIAKSAQCCSSARDIDIATGFVDKWLGLPRTHNGVAGSLLAVTASHFVSRLGDLTAMRGHPPGMLFVLFLGAGMAGASAARSPRDRTRLVATSVMLALGAIAFGATQLLFYLYSLSDIEARALASFERFQNTYYLGWGLATIGLLAMATHHKQEGYDFRTRDCILLAALAILPFALSNHILHRLKAVAPPMTSERADIRDWVIPQLAAIPSSAKLYVVWQGTSGIEFWMIRHEALPRKTNNFCFSLGSPHFSDDIWSCPKPEAELAAEWASYDYVIVGHGLADLKANYPSLLAAVPDNLDRGLFQVRHGERISLVLVSSEENSVAKSANRAPVEQPQ